MKMLLALFLACFASLSTAQDRVELQLVLAFDVSASVNDVEFDLQRSGTAAALRTASIAAAIEAAPGGVAISIIQWSSVTRQAIGLDWVLLQDRNEVAAYAETVNVMPRRLSGGGTMIHSGLDFAERMFATAPGTARRRVIDLAGNGRTDDLDRLAETRDRLRRAGITINGLAIEELNNDLTSYFHAHLISGPGAFVVSADEFEDIAEAMQIKLYMEISGLVVTERRNRAVDRAIATR